MEKIIDAYQRLMIQRNKWITRGYTKEEYTQFEQDVINGYISEDITKNLIETKKALEEIKNTKMEILKISEKSHNYFKYTVIVAGFGIVISIIGIIISLFY